MSEALCQCGHKVDHHFAPRNGECRWCECKSATPPPTREPIRLTDEAEAPWLEWLNTARGGPTLADAWDEGHAADCGYCELWPGDPEHANPYRTPESEDTE